MSEALLFIVFRGLEIQMKVERNSTKFPPKTMAPKEAHGRGVASLHALWAF